MKKIAAATALTALLWTACSTAHPELAQKVELGTAFKLPVGGSAALGQGEMRVGFDAVISDSRCPKGEQCVSAGDAIVRVWLQNAAGVRKTLDLRLSAQSGPAPQALGHQLRLIGLEPYPVSGKPIARADYRATLMLERAAVGELAGTL